MQSFSLYAATMKETPGGGGYKVWLSIGMVVIVLAIVGLFIWKGQALLHPGQSTNTDNADMGGYDTSTPSHK